VVDEKSFQKVKEWVAGWTNTNFVRKATLPVLRGEWKPIIVSANANHTSTYTSNRGQWERHGDVLFYQIQIVIDTISAAGTGAIRIDVPFFFDGVSTGVLSLSGLDLTVNAVQATFEVVNDNGYGTIRQTFDDATGVFLGVTSLATGDFIRISGFGFVE
jgi:hypothetical protein